MKDERIRASQAQEKRGSRKFGGRVVPGSGSQWSRKGDVRTNDELIEYKTVISGKTQITLKAAALKKITTEALIEGRNALLGFAVGGRNYVVQTEDQYLEMRWLAYGESSTDQDRGGQRRVASDGTLQGGRPRSVLSGDGGGTERGEGSVSGLPGAEPVSGVRPRQQRTFRRVGRSQRAGTPSDSEAAT